MSDLDHDFHPRAWGGAAFLAERRPDDAPWDAERQARADAALAAWEQQMLAGPDALGRRLETSNLTRDDFARLVTAPAEARPDAHAFHAFVAGLRRALTSAPAALPESAWENVVSGSRGLPFAGFLRPFLSDALARLRDDAAGLAPGLLRPEAEADLARSLARRLLALATPTLVLELNVARLRGLLPGDTPEERFRHFSGPHFDAPGTRLELLREYPVLARLLVVTAERWREAAAELLARLQADRERLSAAFAGGADLGGVVGLGLGLSDPHRGGRGVVVVRFEQGARAVYKPRRLAADRVFQGLLDWLNGAGLPHPQRTLRVVEAETHGWVEFVQPGGCATRAEVERFYWRQGSFLALLHALHAVDFHYENLIAAGEHPVLVDLEALFHPRREPPADGAAHTAAQRFLNRSVFGIGLLPVLTVGPGQRAVDLSGFGGRQGEVYPRPLPVLHAHDTDRMHLAPADVPVAGGRNRPTLEGRDVDPGDYAEAVADGFERTHALLREQQARLADWLRAFATVEVRAIARPTMRYALFLQEGAHPDYLRDALDRERLLDKLWAEAEHDPVLARLVASEQEDLRLGDVPLFAARPGERGVEDSLGRPVPDFFEASGLDLALARVAALDAEDARRQARMIRQALVPAGGPSAVSQPDQARARVPRSLPPRADVLAAAVTLGEHLARHAVRGDDDAAWIGPTLRPGEHWRWELSPLVTTLYEGLAGVALFLAHLAALTGRADFEDLARRAALPVRRHLTARDPAGYADIGAFSGRAGLVYAATHLAALWRDDGWLDDALGSLPQLAEQAEADQGLDVLMGSAGCARVMLDLHRRTGSAEALDVARRCGARLLATAQPQKVGLGWAGAAARLPLAGFSHGVAGIAWALLDLEAATGDGRLREAALGGLAYERSLFRPQAQNWLDRREFEGLADGFFTLAWCHGSPGVALGRCLALPHLDDPTVREEIRIGIDETLRHGFGGNQSLCHGDLGTADIVLRAADSLDRPDWREAALAQAGRVVAEVRAGEWRTGLPRHTECPGLLTGLAGIGYGLLRLYDREQVPAVLWLEPPRA